MSTILANVPNANNNVQQQALDPVITSISREADFFEKLDFATRTELFSLKRTLENAVRQFGEVRTPLLDLCRMRLSQLRQHLA